ncbi:MAG: hypothetical protein PQJ58_17220 [Spirochaetales bacterium]|nr:hypothetical protein [Spirochaetales bacterium]
MEYVFNENGKIHHCCGSTLPRGAIEVFRWNGTPGEPWEWYKKGIRISNDELLKAGIRQDFKGTYFDKEKQKHTITALDEKPDSSWTKEKWDHITDVLDEEKGIWVEDSEKKKDYQKNLLRRKRSTEFFLFDKYQLPLPWCSLSQKQQDDYISWRDAWLQAPDTGIEPDRPDWFQE